MDDIVRQATAELADSGNVVSLGLGLLALLLVSNGPAWRVLRNAVTIGHEGGHAVVALLSGRRLNGIRLHSDTSGLTVSTGRATGPGMVCTLFAGYPAASLLGLGGAALVSFDAARAMLWISVGLLAAMLVAIRNAYGVLSIVLTGAVVGAVSWWAPPAWQAVCCVLMSWFLLLGGMRPIAELRRKRRRQHTPHSDADQLARLTRIPATVWLASWTVLGLAALVVGGRWLLLIPQL